MKLHPLLFALLVSFSCLALVACDDEEEVPAESPDPVVGIMELPISLRHQPNAPANAIKLEISPSRLRVDGTTLIELDAGDVPEAELANDRITKLEAAITAAPARASAVIRAHANTPYMTTARIMNTLKAASIREVAFEVRAGPGSQTGFLVIPRFDVRTETDDFHTFEGAGQRQWNDFTQGWEEAYNGCRRDHYVDCSFKPGNIAQGGKLNIILFARGQAVKVDLAQFDAPEVEATNAPQPQLLDGIAPEPAAEEEEAPPATTAAFTWRFLAATDELSPVSAMMRPLCGARPCAAVVTAEGLTMTMTIVSFIGSAFPNGAQPPELMFQIPPR